MTSTTSAGAATTGESESGDLGTAEGLDLPGCDLLSDPLDVCGPDMACDPQTLTCVPSSGTGLVDDPCADDGECTPAMVCFDGRCRELCGLDIPDEAACAGGRVCTDPHTSSLPGVCLEPCLLLTQVCSLDGDACNLAGGTAGSQISVCTSNPGAGIDGDACEADGECLPGYLCTPSGVHSLPCTDAAASCCTPTCDTFEQFCLGLEPTCYLLGIDDQPGAGYCGP